MEDFDVDTNCCNGVNVCPIASISRVSTVLTTARFCLSTPQNASNFPSCPLPVQSDDLLVDQGVVSTSR